MSRYNDEYDDEDNVDHSFRDDMAEDGYCDVQFANEGSALRCATEWNPRNLPCPTCGEADRLTRQDELLGYQCDSCADQAERQY